MKSALLYRQRRGSSQSRWEPYWKPAAQFPLDKRTRDLLLDQGSLTERLIQASNGDFKVIPVLEGWQKPYLNEAKLLKLPTREYVWVREVILTCHGEPWVYARTIIPASSMKGKLGALRKLGNKSLGAWLFRQPQLKRSLFEISQLDVGRSDLNRNCWARRSAFELNGKTVLVAEIFLNRCEL